MKILFMGTPEISAICLDKLIKEGKEVVAAVSGEDKIRGRGKTLTPTAVKALALENSIPVYTPASLKTEEFSKLLRDINPDVIAVVAYGKILPPEVINYPKYGCINVHVSLLPKYRGAAPMQRAVMNGDAETGVTIMYMDEGLDTGDIILQEAFPIEKTDTFETVHDKSAVLGAELLVKALDGMENGTVTRTPQPEGASYAKKITKEELKLDLSLDAEILDPMIRGLTPPTPYVYHNGKMLKIAKATPVDRNGKVGEVLMLDGVGEGSIILACGKGALRITSVVPEGKGRMSAGDFIRGRKIFEGDILT